MGDIVDVGSIPGSRRFPRGGHGNPLQYSCLEYPMDRGAWQVTKCIGSQSQTGMKWLSKAQQHVTCTQQTEKSWDAISLPLSLSMCVQKKCFVFIQIPRTIKFSGFLSYKLVNMSLPEIIIPNYLNLLKVFFFFNTMPEIALWNPLPLNQSWHYYSKWLLGVWEGLQKAADS